MLAKIYLKLGSVPRTRGDSPEFQPALRPVPTGKRVLSGTAQGVRAGSQQLVSPGLPLSALCSCQETYNSARWPRQELIEKNMVAVPKKHIWQSLCCVNLSSAQVARLAVSCLCVSDLKCSLGPGHKRDLRMTMFVECICPRCVS